MFSRTTLHPMKRITASSLNLKRFIIEEPRVAAGSTKTLEIYDYPEDFRGYKGGKICAHPEDYRIDSSPIIPKLIYFRGSYGQNRLFLRSSLKLPIKSEKGEEKFTAATFFLDSGCASHFNICDDLYSFLADRLTSDQFGYYRFMQVNIANREFKCQVVKERGHDRRPVNLIGLPMFLALGMKFNTANINEELLTDLESEGHVKDIENFITMNDFKYF